MRFEHSSEQSNQITTIPLTYIYSYTFNRNSGRENGGYAGHEVCHSRPEVPRDTTKSIYTCKTKNKKKYTYRCIYTCTNRLVVSIVNISRLSVKQDFK